MKNKSIIYEFIIFLFILLYLTIIVTSYSGSEILTPDQIKWADYIFIIYFSIEYVVRLYRAKDKKKFVKENIFDLIALIPFDALFKVARLMRLVRLIRIIKVSKTLQGIFKSGGLTNVFLFTLLIMSWGAASNYILEKGENPNINSLGDSIWWSIVTVSTVGYGDISPVTTGGRIIASILMLVGIGLIGSITGSMAIYFSNIEQTVDSEEDPLGNNEDELDTYIRKQLKKIDKLNEDEFDHLLKSIKVLYQKKNNVRGDSNDV
ncbi:ion transporter [Psychrobacillus sp. FJAT-51614]|uniref:Ion transporter n=1 Tax=Psychrobacillus mangrovi TaxID=3117745 RepID=A0ABU8EZF1_9BACI